MTLLCGGLVTGCESGSQGAKTGVAVGALSGLVIGSLSGNAGKGAAVGAVIGGVGGAVIGDQNKRKREANASAQAPPPTYIAVTGTQRAALSNFAGVWNTTGWSYVIGDERRVVSGSGVGLMEGSNSLTFDLSIIVDEVTRQTNTGTLIFTSQTGGDVKMSSRFSTSPNPSRYAGTVSPDGGAFTFNETTQHANGMRRRIIMRFLSRDQWVVDVIDLNSNNQHLSSFTFTRQ